MTERNTSSDLLQRTDDLLYGLATPTAAERAAALVEWMALQEINAFGLQLWRHGGLFPNGEDRYEVTAKRNSAPQLTRGTGFGRSVATALLDYHCRYNDPSLNLDHLKELVESLVKSEAKENET